MWWRSVHIGSLNFPAWSTVNETISLQQIRTIFQTTSSVYLIVIKALDPLEIIGVIHPAATERICVELKDDKLKMEQPAVQVNGLVSKSYKLMPISGGVIGDLEDEFAGGTIYVILYRSTHILSVIQSNNNEERETVDRRQIIACVTLADLRRWIGQVEGHHNMTSELNSTHNN